MKRLSILTVSLSALLLAGGAYAQDATTRGGAKSAVPSTKQNSPATGAMTAPGANTNTTGGTTSGAASGTMSSPSPSADDNMQRRSNPPSQSK